VSAHTTASKRFILFYILLSLPIYSDNCFSFFLSRRRLRLTWCTAFRFRFLNTVCNKHSTVGRPLETAAAEITTKNTVTQIHTIHTCPKRDSNLRSQWYNSTHLRPHDHCRHSLLFLTSHAHRYTATVTYTFSDDDTSTTDITVSMWNRNSSSEYDMYKLTCRNVTCP
jgi:hypothetical protein